MRSTVTALGLCLLLGCRTAPRTPEQLRQAYLEALRKDDADAAYDLLAASVQAGVSRQEFRQRWQALAKERGLQLQAAEALPPEQGRAALSGRTVHPGGKVLRWVEVAGHWLLLSGLPATADTSTPAQAVRSFLGALRSSNFAALHAILSPELVEALRLDWSRRLAAIERALEQPGALELSSDSQRAELRYDSHRAVVLEQGKHGWVITALE